MLPRKRLDGESEVTSGARHQNCIALLLFEIARVVMMVLIVEMINCKKVAPASHHKYTNTSHEPDKCP